MMVRGEKDNHFRILSEEEAKVVLSEPHCFSFQTTTFKDSSKSTKICHISNPSNVGVSQALPSTWSKRYVEIFLIRLNGLFAHSLCMLTHSVLTLVVLIGRYLSILSTEDTNFCVSTIFPNQIGSTIRSYVNRWGYHLGAVSLAIFRNSFQKKWLKVQKCHLLN